MIDAHQHFWSPTRGDYGWLTPDLAPLYRDFGPDDLRPLLDACGIDGTILVQAAESEAETDYLLDIAAKTDFVCGVVGWLDMQAPDFAARLADYAARPHWIGLRPMLQDHPPEALRGPGFRAALAEVARRDFPFDILTFPRHLPDVLDALAQAPSLRAVVDHISKPDMAAPMAANGWVEDIARLAHHPRIMCKVSGLVTETGADWSAARIRPFLQHVAAAFGPERLIFGSDWPVCTLKASYGEVFALARGLLAEMFGADALQAIFETNALRFYKL